MTVRDDAEGSATDLVGGPAVAAAHDRIRPHVLRTPVIGMFDHGVHLKAENLQRSGSFKLRGAFNTVLQLDDERRARGIVAHSSGNHAIAVAMVGRLLGVATTVVMPSDAPAVKAAPDRRTFRLLIGMMFLPLDGWRIRRIARRTDHSEISVDARFSSLFTHESEYLLFLFLYFYRHGIVAKRNDCSCLYCSFTCFPVADSACRERASSRRV